MSVPFEHSERMPGTTHVCGARGPRGWRGAGSGARGPWGGGVARGQGAGHGDGPALAGVLGLGVLGVGAPELEHEPVDHAVEVNCDSGAPHTPVVS